MRQQLLAVTDAPRRVPGAPSRPVRPSAFRRSNSAAQVSRPPRSAQVDRRDLDRQREAPQQRHDLRAAAALGLVGEPVPPGWWLSISRKASSSGSSSTATKRWRLSCRLSSSAQPGGGEHVQPRGREHVGLGRVQQLGPVDVVEDQQRAGAGGFGCWPAAAPRSASSCSAANAPGRRVSSSFSVVGELDAEAGVGVRIADARPGFAARARPASDRRGTSRRRHRRTGSPARSCPGRPRHARRSSTPSWPSPADLVQPEHLGRAADE